MKRIFLIPFVAAVVGAGIVVAVVAAAGDLGGSATKTVTEFQPAPTSAGATTTAGATNGGAMTYHEIYEHAAPGVVFVTSTVLERNESVFPFESGTTEGQDTGSGIEVDSRGDILTNYHVVAHAVKVTVGLDNSKTVEAKVVGKDPSDDLAVLRIPTEGLTLHPLTLGDSSAVQVGEPVAAIGNPFDLQRTLTTGVVSALQRRLEAPNGFTIYNVIQTDAPINPGNSGGPLLNARGEVIGIDSQIETAGTDGNIGIGFAVPINTAKAQLHALEEGQTVSAAYLGVATITINGSLSPLNLPVKSGVLVQEVEKGSGADKAGIRGGDLSTTIDGEPIVIGGDIITEVDGKKISSSEDLQRYIEAKQPGEEVTITLLEASGDGKYKEKKVTATLGKRPNTAPGENEPSTGGGLGTPELNTPEG